MNYFQSKRRFLAYFLLLTILCASLPLTKTQAASDFKIKKGVLTIGASAFYDCTKLKSVTLPKGLKSIDSNAFSGCANLVSVIIPLGTVNTVIKKFL